MTDYEKMDEVVKIIERVLKNFSCDDKRCRCWIHQLRAAVKRARS